jgi:hypothetical protein
VSRICPYRFPPFVLEFKEKRKQDAKNHSIFVVRSSGRRGSEVLYLHFQNSKVGRIAHYDKAAAKDPEKSERVMKAMLQMKKIDIGKLNAVYRGK